MKRKIVYVRLVQLLILQTLPVWTPRKINADFEAAEIFSLDKGFAKVEEDFTALKRSV